jgi:hypothetical protein
MSGVGCRVSEGKGTRVVEGGKWGRVPGRGTRPARGGHCGEWPSGKAGSVVAGWGGIFLVVFGLVAGEGFSFIGVAIEAVGEDEEGGSPEADEDAEAFRVGALFGLVSLEEPPDADGEDDGEDSELETDGT